MKTAPLEVTLYARPGCHLCEQAEAELARFRRQYPHTLTVIDVSTDANLGARYGERIPVLVVPLWPETIERALHAATPTAPPKQTR
jgi:hypothetical protein